MEQVSQHSTLDRSLLNSKPTESVVPTQSNLLFFILQIFLITASLGLVSFVLSSFFNFSR
jgi:hypothetical protein